MDSELLRWVKFIGIMLTIGVSVLLIILAKVTEIRNKINGKGGHL